VVDYSGPLNPTAAADVAAYQLVTASKGKKRGKPVALASATYSATTDAVTLSFKGNKFPTQTVQMDINAGLVTDPQDRPLNGGHDYLATVSPNGAVVPAAVQSALSSRVSAEAVDVLLSLDRLPAARGRWRGNGN
jgi:hypothetical protein